MILLKWFYHLMKSKKKLKTDYSQKKFEEQNYFEKKLE